MALRPDHRNRNVNEILPQPEFLETGPTQIAPHDGRIGSLVYAPEPAAVETAQQNPAANVRAETLERIVFSAHPGGEEVGHLIEIAFHRDRTVNLGHAETEQLANRPAAIRLSLAG